MKPALIFDLDGVLADSTRPIIDCINAALEAIGRDRLSDAEVHTRRVRLPASSYDQLAEHNPEVAQKLRERQTSWPLRSLYYPDYRSQAAYNLAVLRAQAGELDAAETLYRWVVDRGHLDLGPAAMIALGRLCAQQGKVEEARGWLQYATGTSIPSTRRRQQPS